MKIIILGASGMLGHMVSLYFKKKYSSNIILCSRSNTDIESLDKILKKFSEYSKKNISNLINSNRPCKIINCVSINNAKTSREKLDTINYKLPKMLAEILDEKKDGSQLVHISTNGVFLGNKGDYTEKDETDTKNKYGKSKLKGEIIHSPHVTIRTSIIGPELKSYKGLFEWFLKQKKEVKGYTEVKWNGVTTLECAKFIDWLINQKISGLVHLFSQKISKYDLFNIIKKIYAKNIKVLPDSNIKEDLTLNTSRKDIKYDVPKISEMLVELKSVSF